MPTPKTLSDIKANLLLKPALTSHFEVEVGYPTKSGNFIDYLKDNGVAYTPATSGTLTLLCSEATLPGSSLATHEINNDFHGVTERHVYRRIYDDRIDLTFYVDAQNYMPIRFFETWIKYIVNESIAEKRDSGGNLLGPVGSRNSQYFYRVRYPNDYKGSLKVVKFERDYASNLTYDFIDAFPISISSMPISYDSSSLLKCTVSMTYVRYILSPSSKNNDKVADQTPLSSENQVVLNNEYNWAQNYNQSLEGGFNVGGVPDLSALSSGNTVSGFTVGANSNIA